MEIINKLWMIITLIIPGIYTADDNDTPHLQIFAPKAMEDSLTGILTKNRPNSRYSFSYDTVPSAIVDVAFDKVMTNLARIREDFTRLDIIGKSYMCGFGELLKEHQEKLDKIEDDLVYHQLAFFRYTAVRSRRLTIVDSKDESIKKVPSVCEWVAHYFYNNDDSHTNVLFHIFTPEETGNDNWMVPIAETFKKTWRDNVDAFCGLGRSPQTYFYGMLIRVLSTAYRGTIKTRVTREFVRKYVADDECKAANALTISGDELPTNYDAVHRFFDRYEGIMSSMPTDIFACDSKKLMRDQNFIELEGAFQDIVLPSNYLYDNHECANVGTLHSNYQGFYDGYCNSGDQTCVSLPRSCRGTVYDCKSGVYWHTDRISYCQLESGPRRYLWLDYYNGPGLPSWEVRSKECSDVGGNYDETSGGNSKTQVCICTCNDNKVNSMSTHVVNLMPVEADYKENKVVTGVRFIVQRRVLHIQIQQGVLGDNLIIEDAEWKPVDDISERVYASRLGTAGKSALKQDQDYLIITKDTHDKFDLGSHRVGAEEVVTGVQLFLSQGHIKLRVIGRTVDVATAKICSDCPVKQYYTGKPNTVPYSVPGTRVLQEQATPYNWIRDQAGYVTFHASSRENDFGQSTMPYFDAVPVTTYPPAPLSGLGTFLRVSTQQVGLISPQLHSFHYSGYLYLMNQKF